MANLSSICHETIPYIHQAQASPFAMSQLTISLFDIPKKTGATGSVGAGPSLIMSPCWHHQPLPGTSVTRDTAATRSPTYRGLQFWQFLLLRHNIEYSDTFLIFIGRQYEFKDIAKMLWITRHDAHVRTSI